MEEHHMSQIDWSVLSGPRVSRRTLLRLAAASGAAGYASTLAAPTKAAPSRLQGDTPKQGGTLRLGYGISQIITLDPAQVTQGIVAGELVANIFSSLVQFDQELGIQADLAENWTVSDDGLNYTFTLRSGLTFHNGDSLTAEDFVYTYERTTDETFASPHANKLSLVERIEAADELNLNLTLSQPSAPFLATACSRGPGRALTPVSKRAVEEMGNEQFGITPVGSGPFMVVAESAEVGTGFDMVAFDGWYGGRPFLDEVKVQIITEDSSLVSALEAGDVDMIDILPSVGVETVQGNDEITIVEAPGTNWTGLTMNQARPPWDTVEARMAVSKAIDREEFVNKAFFGLADVSSGPIAPSFAWVYRPPEEVENPQAFDLDEAKQLASEAGLEGAKPVLMSVDGNPRPAEVMRGILRDIGLDVQIEQLQSAAWNERWLAGDYDMLINGSVVDADPDDGIWNFFYSEGPWNSYGYASEEADDLLEKQRASTDEEERTKLLQELQTILEEDVAYAFLYHTPDRTAFHTDVQGYVAVPEQRYLETVWLDR
jgi:peptide/nickel transport system substrate-binding protein